MLGLAKGLQEKASQNGISLPVIDPTGAAIGYLELLVRNGIAHSKLTFPVPTEKDRRF